MCNTGKGRGFVEYIFYEASYSEVGDVLKTPALNVMMYMLLTYQNHHRAAHQHDTDCKENVQRLWWQRGEDESADNGHLCGKEEMSGLAILKSFSRTV